MHPKSVIAQNAATHPGPLYGPGLKIFFSDKGIKIPRKWRKIAKQGAPFGPLQKLGTL